MKAFFTARRNRNQNVIPAKAGIQKNPPVMDWIPISMGMTELMNSRSPSVAMFSVFCLVMICLLLAALPACRPAGITAKKTGQIYVTTDPAGATLFCDSVNGGDTPATIASVASGEHLLVVRKPGYRETRATRVTTRAGERLAVELKLEEIKGLVLVHSVPAGADVELDGANIGKTPLLFHDCLLGQRRLQISMPGYLSKSVNINVEDRTPLKVAVSLTSDSAELFVESSPTGAVVTIDNSVVGTTPLMFSGAKTGKHTLELTLKGHLSVQHEITLQAGDKPEQTFKGIIREKYANGDMKVEVEPGIFKTFGKTEISSIETIPAH